MLAGIRVFLRVFTVFLDEGGRVDHDEADSDAVVFQHFGIVAGIHVPACAHFGVIQDGLRVAPVLMVAEDGIPGQHQFGVAVNEFVVGHPQRIPRAAHAFEMMHVSGCHHAFDVHRFGHLAHQFGYGFLVIVAVAPEVVGQVEVQRFFQGFPFRSVLRVHPGGKYR